MEKSPRAVLNNNK